MRKKKTIIYGPLKIEHLPTAVANNGDEDSLGHMWDASLQFKGDDRGGHPTADLTLLFDIDDREDRPLAEAASALLAMAHRLDVFASDVWADSLPLEIRKTRIGKRSKGGAV